MKAFRTINKASLVVLVAGVLLCLQTQSADAINIDPSNADWQGSDPNNPDADDVETITGFGGDLTELYKDEVGGVESGPFLGSYSTTYANSSTEPEDFTISYGVGDVITDAVKYLVVKDGNHNPIWYIFDITSWNGKADIVGTDFWPKKGNVSHVTIYGGAKGVPDGGATFALLGISLMGLHRVQRTFKKS